MRTKTACRLIFLTDDSMLISKKHYDDWKQIQDEYDNYMTDMLFPDIEEIIKFFEEDYGDERYFPFSKEAMRNFAKSDEIILWE